MRSIWEKAAEFARTATSGFADEATVARRRESCKSCPKRVTRHNGAEVDDYCGACDCPEWPLARLDRKLLFRGLTCPLARPGFANEGQNVKPGDCPTCTGERVFTRFAQGSRVRFAVALDGDAADVQGVWQVREVRPDGVCELERRRWIFWKKTILAHAELLRAA